MPPIMFRFGSEVHGGPSPHSIDRGRPDLEPPSYVEDAARGIVAATERYDGAEPVNIGSGQEISIRDLVELVAELVGYEGEVR